MTSPPAWHPQSLAARLPYLQARARLTRATRDFFAGRGYTEVETPYAVPTPGEDVHLAAFRTEHIDAYGNRRSLYLHTSPEFAMKRLLVAGAGKIFQLARVWRNEQGSATHAPEFTMLEWYAPGATLADLMDETEALLRATLPASVTWAGHTASVAGFARLTVAQAFLRYAGVDLLATAGDPRALAAHAGAIPRPAETWEDLLLRLLLERIEPRLIQPTFLTHWPIAQAALARPDPADKRVALRCELFLGTLELANGFEELTDAAEQRSRFEADRARRAALTGTTDWPMDEDFLAALEHGMPPCSGIALGFDRLAMLASGASSIDRVLWLGGS